VDARKAALTVTFTAMGVALRLLKHAVAGALQFVNTPLFATFVAAYVGGSVVGGLTGLLTFFVSDAVLGLGPWTLVNSALALLIGSAWGRIDLRGSTAAEVFALSFLTSFAYDVASSFALYVIFFSDPRVALLYALLGLFVPVAGGYLLGVGPITEFTTAALTTLVASKLARQALPARERQHGARH